MSINPSGEEPVLRHLWLEPLTLGALPLTNRHKTVWYQRTALSPGSQDVHSEPAQLSWQLLASIHSDSVGLLSSFCIPDPELGPQS